MIPVKSARHQAILDLIEQHPIDRQEDLLAHLREEGFDVTQATVCLLYTSPSPRD